MKVLFRLLLSIGLIASGHDCVELNDNFPDGAMKYVCEGSVAVLPWALTLSEGEEILQIEWFFDGPNGKKQFAVLVREMFIPMGDHSERVSFVPNAGIAVGNVMENDTGTYSVTITGNGPAGLFVLTEHNFLHVIGAPLTSGGQLHVSQGLDAVFNNATGQWEIELTCGTFPFPDHPPFDVVWTSPTGNSLTSSHYQNGKFYISLNQSQASGTYVCRLPEYTGCAGVSDTQETKSSFLIDDFKSKLAFLEVQFKVSISEARESAKQMADLTVCNEQLQQLNSSLNQQIAILREQSDNLKEENKLLAGDNEKLSRKLLSLENRIEQLEKANSSAEIEALSSHCSQGCAVVNQTVGDLKVHFDDEIARMIQQFDAQQGGLNQTIQHLSRDSQVLAEQNTRLNEISQEILALEQLVHIVRNSHEHIQTSFNLRVPHLSSFHARLADDNEFRENNVIIMSEVLNNEGNAYDRKTGIFTAPVSGTYFFIASTASRSAAETADFYLMVDEAPLNHLQLHSNTDRHESGTVHGITHLVRGQKVYLRNGGSTTHLWTSASAFSGFLIHEN